MNETRYLDYVVHVPSYFNSYGRYMGYVVYRDSIHHYELRMYYDQRVDLYDVNAQAVVATTGALTSGATHNIGFCVGTDAPGVWIDGALVFAMPTTLGTDTKGGFGVTTTAQGMMAPLTLLENLCYVKAFHRADAGEPAALPGQPVVHVTQFDGPRPCTVYDPVNINGNWSPMKVVEVGACGGRVTVTHGASSETTISLASGRRVAGVLVTNDADGLVYADGDLLENPTGPAPGVSTYVFTDAVGASYCYDRVLPDLPADPSTYGMTGNTPVPPVFDFFYVAIGLGQHTGPTSANPGWVSAGPSIPMVSMGSALTSSDGTGQNADAGGDDCPCSCGAVNLPMIATVSKDTSTGLLTDMIGGLGDYPPGIMFNGDGDEGVIWDKKEHIDDTDLANGNVYFTAYGVKYRLLNPTKGEDGLYDVSHKNLELVDKKGTSDPMKPLSEDEGAMTKLIGDLGKFGGQGGQSPEVVARMKEGGLDTLGTVLDVIGFVPVVGDLADMANVLVAIGNDDIVGGALSGIAMIPGVGSIIAAPVKWAWKAGRKIAWKKFFNIVEDVLSKECLTDGLRAQVQAYLKQIRDELVSKHGIDLPAGWCFTAGTPVETSSGSVSIEELQPGDRVVTPGSERDHSTPTQVDPSTWRLVELRLPNSDCPWDVISLRLLRPLWWLAENAAAAGSHVPICIEEMGLSGLATVTAVLPCPPVKPGRGRVVTGTVSHFNGYVWRLTFDGCDVEPTDVHPFYSLDRAAWVGAAALHEGERASTAGGHSAILERKQRVPGIHRVYNLEVEGERCFYVGRQALLVHNGCIDEAGDVADDAADAGKVAGDGVKAADSAKNLTGAAFEEWIQKNLKASPGFSKGGRQFDAAIGNRWIEAKSGKFWEKHCSSVDDINDFKSSMGQRLSIARSNGATYELHSNTPVPDAIKAWCKEKGIAVFEHLD